MGIPAGREQSQALSPMRPWQFPRPLSREQFLVYQRVSATHETSSCCPCLWHRKGGVSCGCSEQGVPQCPLGTSLQTGQRLCGHSQGHCEGDCTRGLFWSRGWGWVLSLDTLEGKGSAFLYRDRRESGLPARQVLSRPWLCRASLTRRTSGGMALSHWSPGHWQALPGGPCT